MLFSRARKSFWEVLQAARSREVGAVSFGKVWARRPHVSRGEMESVPEGSRADVLFDLACHLVFSGAVPAAELPPFLRLVYGVAGFEMDVNCDGLSGFFTGSRAFLAPEVAVWLGEIGAEKARGILSRALAEINPGGLDGAELSRALASEEIAALWDDDALDGRLHALDMEFYESGEAVAPLLNAYIKENFAGV